MVSGCDAQFSADAAQEAADGWLTAPWGESTNWSEVATEIRRRVGKAVTPDGDPEEVLESIAKVAR